MKLQITTMMVALAALILLIAGCTTLPPSGQPPVGFSTYGRTADGKRVRLWTDDLTGTTTGTIGGESVRLKSY
jgi:hypothetical protein